MAIFHPELKAENICHPYTPHWKPLDMAGSSVFADLSHNDKNQVAGLIISPQSSHYSEIILYFKPFLPHSLIPALRINYQPAFLESQAEALQSTSTQACPEEQGKRWCSLAPGVPISNPDFRGWRTNALYLQSCTSECQSHSPLPAPAHMTVFLTFLLESRHGDRGSHWDKL